LDSFHPQFARLYTFKTPSELPHFLSQEYGSGKESQRLALRAAEMEKLTKLRMPDNPAAITRYINDIDTTVARLVDLGIPIQPQDLMIRIVKSIDNLKDRSQQILRDQS
jgi:tetrahydromethanopterin S-methyltransferase subunit F